MEDLSLLLQIAGFIACFFVGFAIGTYEGNQSELLESQIKAVADRMNAFAERKEARDLAYEAERVLLFKALETAVSEYAKAASGSNGGAA